MPYALKNLSRLGKVFTMFSNSLVANDIAKAEGRVERVNTKDELRLLVIVGVRICVWIVRCVRYST